MENVAFGALKWRQSRRAGPSHLVPIKTRRQVNHEYPGTKIPRLHHLRLAVVTCTILRRAALVPTIMYGVLCPLCCADAIICMQTHAAHTQPNSAGSRPVCGS